MLRGPFSSLALRGRWREATEGVFLSDCALLEAVSPSVSLREPMTVYDQTRRKRGEEKRHASPTPTATNLSHPFTPAPC
jgi:hypothetical protein